MDPNGGIGFRPPCTKSMKVGDTKEEAERELARLQLKMPELRSVYYCHDCHCYHATKRGKNWLKSRRKRNNRKARTA